MCTHTAPLEAVLLYDDVMVDVGDVLGERYALRSTLGEGGMGTVFEALDQQTNQTVAIKVLLPDVHEPELFARFQREARAASAIDSPHVVRVFGMEADEASDSPFLVMEHLEGYDLADVLCRESMLDESVAMRIAHQIALGLGAAHRAGFVHRDVKPANIFLVRDPQGGLHVKLLDFGVAKLGSGGGTDDIRTQTGAIMGSPHYISPEQAVGAKEVTTTTDIWSLGILLYRMVAGRFPHPSGKLLETMHVVATGEPRPLLELAPWVDPQLAAVIMRALSRRPDARYATAEDMAAALRGLRHVAVADAPFAESDIKAPEPERTVNAPPMSDPNLERHLELAGSIRDMTPSEFFSAVQESPKKKRPRVGVIAIAFAVVLGIAAAGVSVRSVLFHERVESVERAH